MILSVVRTDELRQKITVGETKRIMEISSYGSSETNKVQGVMWDRPRSNVGQTQTKLVGLPTVSNTQTSFKE